MQKTVDRILAQLSEAYQTRDALWTQLDEDLDRCGTLFQSLRLSVLNYSVWPWCQTAERAKTAIAALPGDVETMIAKLEKKSKDLEKNANSASSKQKILKGLLERL